MPDYKHIILETSVGDGIAKLTLNRPERRNALNDVMATLNRYRKI